MHTHYTAHLIQDSGTGSLLTYVWGMNSDSEKVEYIRGFAEKNDLTCMAVENMLCKIWVVKYSKLKPIYNEVGDIKWA